MSDSKAEDQGLHYHYHFYGAPTPAGYPPAGFGTGAQAPQPQAPQPQAPYGGPAGAPPPFGAGFPPPPPGFPPYAAAAPQGAAQANPNAHRHPNADSLVKGLVVGAAAAYLLTNETAQRTILRTAVQVWTKLQGGFEEIKERLHDAEAEVAAASEPPAPAPAAPSSVVEAPAPVAPPAPATPFIVGT